MRALFLAACMAATLFGAGRAGGVVPASWGTAIHFDGGVGRVEVGAVTGFPSTALTLSLWMKGDGVLGEGALVSYAVAGPCGSAFSVRHPGHLEIELGCQTIVTGLDLRDAGWHFLVVAWQSEGGLIEVMWDGELVLQQSGFQAGAALTDGGTWVVGQQQGCLGGCFGGEPGFRGTIDEVRIWDHARSVEQVREDRDRLLRGPETGLALAWSFDEGRFGGGAGAVVWDLSGKGNHGSLAGFSLPRRTPGQLWPQMVLSGTNPLEVECHDAYLEPGASVVAAPVMVAAGYAHNLGLRGDGRLVGWGSADAGQLRIDTTNAEFVAVSAGARHSLALRRDGRVIAWGDNAWGQASVPDAATHAVAISAGVVHSVALLQDGRALTWGHPDVSGEVVPSTATNLVAVVAGSLFNLGLRGDGMVMAWGRDDYGQQRIPGHATNVVSIAASYRHAMALRRDGTVVSWGANDQGQADVPETAVNVVAISAGYAHSLALLDDGRVVAWGDNREGQCNVPDLPVPAVAVAAGGNHSLALLADGAVVGWGRSEEGALEAPERLEAVESVIRITGVVGVNVPGDYMRDYTAWLAEGDSLVAQRGVTVVDTASPVLEFPGEDPWRVEVRGAFEPPEVVATDACEGDLTDQLTVRGSVDTDHVGVYPLVYEVADGSGNSNRVEREVWVVGAPSIKQLRAVLAGTAGVRSARLEAEVVPNGLVGSAWFEVGASDGSLTNQTEPSVLPEGYDVRPVAVDLEELVPGSEVRYQLVASNVVGVVKSGDRVLRVPAEYVPGDASGDGIVDQAELDAVLAHYWPYSPWLAMTNVVVGGDGTVEFALTNATAWTFTVEVSTNAVDWEPLGSAVPVYQFQDAAASEAPLRFYRLRWP